MQRYFPDIKTATLIKVTGGFLILLAIIIYTLSYLNYRTTPRPLVITDQVGEASITYGVDQSVIWFNESCFEFYWNLEAIQAVYFNNQATIGQDTREICDGLSEHTLRVVFVDQSEMVYTIPIQTAHNTWSVIISLVGVLMLIAGFHWHNLKEVLISARRQPGFVVGLLLIVVIGGGLRWYALDNLEHIYQYESSLWLNSDIKPAHNFACTYLSPFCVANEISPSAQRLFVNSFDGRRGLPLILSGIAVAFQPLSQENYQDIFEFYRDALQVIHYTIDLMIALLIVAIIKRLSFPGWAAIAGGLLFVTCIPIIIDSATILREAPARLGLMLAITGYIHAYYSERPGNIITWIIVGTAGTYLLGFASPPNHPVMTVIFGTFVIISLIQRHRPLLRIGVQSALILITIIGLWQYVPYVSEFKDVSQQETRSLMLTGLNSEGSSTGLTTIMSCASIWCRTNELIGVTTPSLVDSLLSGTPLDVIGRYLYSVYGNVIAASNVYSQHLILSPDGQFTQQVILLLFGIPGIAYLMGYGKRYWATLLIVGLPVAYFIAVFSINGIEPRRLTGVLQIFILAGAVYFYALTQVYRVSPANIAYIVLSGGLALFLWMLPVDLLVEILPVDIALLVLQSLRGLMGMVFVGANLFAWWQQDQDFNLWLSGSVLVLALIIVTYADFVEQNELEWQMVVNDEIQQIFTDDFSNAEHWLLIDVETREASESLEIRLNDRVLKPVGVPMYPYIDRAAIVASHISRFGIEDYRLWHAYPVSAGELDRDDNSIVVSIRAESPVTVYGNYLLADNTYVGPDTDPFSGISFAYLLYSYFEGRMPTTFNIQDVTSIRSENTNDLSQAPGKQTGIYRILIVEDQEYEIVDELRCEDADDCVLRQMDRDR